MMMMSFFSRIGLLTLIFSVALMNAVAQNSVDSNNSSSLKTIILDAGHGGFDGGASGTTSKEKDVALAVTLRLGKAIEKELPNVRVVYTRTTDIMPGNKRTKDEGLRYRADLANQENGDLFISIHLNAAGQRPGGWYQNVRTGTQTKRVKVKGKWVNRSVPKYEKVWKENTAKGTETYIWALNKNEAKINSVNKMEYYGELDSTTTLTLPDPKDPVARAHLLIYAQQFFKKSLSLAHYIEKEFEKVGRVSRGVKQRNDEGIWVLQATGMPSILVEIGFISNTEEEKYMNSDKGQDEIVNNILTGIKEYKSRVDKIND